MFALMSVVYVLGAQPAGWLTDKIGKPPVIALACLTISAGIGTFAGFDVPTVGRFDFPIYFSLSLWSIGSTLLGVSFFFLFLSLALRRKKTDTNDPARNSQTAPTAYVTDLTLPYQRSQALALHRTVGDVGLLIGSLSSGVVADVSSTDAAMRLNAGLLMGSTLWFAKTTLFDEFIARRAEKLRLEGEAGDEARDRQQKATTTTYKR